MLLQVQRVSTVISCTEMQWENAIEKSKMHSQCGFGFGFGLEKEVTWQTQQVNLELQTPKMHQNNNQMIHKAH